MSSLEYLLGLIIWGVLVYFFIKLIEYILDLIGVRKSDSFQQSKTKNTRAFFRSIFKKNK